MFNKRKTLLMLVLALLLLAVIPGVAQAAPAKTAPIKTAFTGTDRFLYDRYFGDVYFTDDGIMHIRNGLSVAEMTTTDPRLNGEYTFTFNADFELRPEPVMVTGPMWGTFLLEDQTGYWEGTYTGYRDEFGHSRFKYVASGGGGYAGLGLKLFYKRLDADPSVPAMLSGVIRES